MKTPGRNTKDFNQALIFGAVIGLALFSRCAPRQEPSQGLEDLQAQLESARKERDSLLEKLDASTRERVDLDGEANRLREELEKLKAQKESSGSKAP